MNKAARNALLTITNMRRHREYGGGLLEGDNPRSPAEAERILKERNEAELARTQAALKAEADALYATPEWQNAQAEKVNATSFNPARLQSMTPQADLGLPSFKTPQQANAELNDAVAFGNNLERRERMNDVGSALKETWPVKAAEDIYEAAKTPGEAAMGRFDPMANPDLAVKRMFDLGGTLTSGGLPIASRNPNQMNIFAGQGAKTADRNALARAQEMERAGAHTDTIWQETGWWRAPDQNWKFEIPDQEMGGPILRGYKLPAEVAIDHEQLFKAYPQLRELPVQSANLGENLHGYFQPGYGNTPGHIVINSRLTPEQAKSTILHELQHVVQNYEGFSPGANPEVYQFPVEKINRLREQRDALYQAYAIRSLMENQGLTKEQAVAEFARNNDQFMPIAADYANAPFDRIAKNIDDVLLALQLPRDKGFEGYQRTAGEVEARNVQNRFDNSPEANQAVSPAYTQDYPSGQQVIRQPENSAAPSMSITPPVERKLNDIGLYSHGAESAQSLPQARGTPQQMKAMLERAGVKPEEMKGFEEAFAGQQSITREQAAAFFNDRMPKLEETTLRAREGMPDDPQEAIAQLATDAANNEQLYRDITAGDRTVPWENSTPDQRADYLMMDAPELVDEYMRSPLYGENPPKYAEYTMPGGTNYREVLLRMPGDNRQFSSHHWDDPNVVAHLRMKDRTGPNGERVLHVEELQSDWAQEGRKKGFKGLSDPDAVAKYEDLVKSVTEKWIEVNAERAYRNSPAKYNNNIDEAYETARIAAARIPPEYLAFQVGKENEFNALSEAAKKAQSSLNPAPYVTNTQSWTDLALKRVLKEAVENGYDSVMFTNGETQAKRYGLGEGEGMKGYYDRIVPGQLQKMLKRIDPSVKLGRTENNAEAIKKQLAELAEKDKQDTPGVYSLEAQQRQKVRTELQKLLAREENEMPAGMMTIPITPKMREAVRKGLPAFKDGGAVPSPAQIEAGNYKKHHVRKLGFDIAIENRRGEVRSGMDNGKRWSVKMPADYGYIKRTEGADGDHVDVYLGPSDTSQRVWVINQQDHRTNKFDEHKVMLGFNSQDQALKTYRAGFSDGHGHARIQSVREMSVSEFKNWLKHGDQSKTLTHKALLLCQKLGPDAAQRAVNLARSK